MSNRLIATMVGSGLALSCWIGAAHGQLIGTVPEAAPATPEYVPPPPPPPPPPRPEIKPEPEVVVASLVVRDEAGKLVQYPQGVERAALEAMETTPEQREKIQAALAAREQDLERFAADKVPALLEVEELRGSIAGSADLKQFGRIREAISALTTDTVLERLSRDGAITPRQRQKLDAAVREYTSAATTDATAEAGEDFNKAIAMSAREALSRTDEVVAAYNRLLDRLAARLDTVQPPPSLTADQRAQMDRLARQGDDQRGQGVRTWFVSLDPEAQQALLWQVAPPAPPAPEDQAGEPTPE